MAALLHADRAADESSSCSGRSWERAPRPPAPPPPLPSPCRRSGSPCARRASSAGLAAVVALELPRVRRAPGGPRRL
eukprot:1638727-Prymnesium_polylepis.1